MRFTIAIFVIGKIQAWQKRDRETESETKDQNGYRCGGD